MSDILIRPASDADGAGLAALIAGVFAEYEGCVFDPAEFPELDGVASHFAGRGGIVWVAEQDGTLIGSLAVAPCDEPATFELFKLYVAQAARGRGLAAALLQKALVFARARGGGALRLWTDTRFLDAHRFYERHGFERQPGSRPLHDRSRSWEFPYRRRIAEA